MLLDVDGYCAGVIPSFSLCCIVEESSCVAMVHLANLFFLALLGEPCSSDASSTGGGGRLPCSSATTVSSGCSALFGAGNDDVGC